MITGNMIWGVFLSILAVVILSTNAYVFFIIYKCKSLRTRSNAFLLSLAFSDFAIALFNVPFTAASSFSPRLRTSGSTLCEVSGVLEMTFLIASVFSVTAMNFHRYVHIIYWQKYYDLFSVRKVCFLIIFIWITAVALSIPPLVGLSEISYKQGKSHCFVDWKETPAYTFTLMTTCFFLPLFLMGYFYARIYHHRKQSKKELKYMSERMDTTNSLKGSSGKMKSHISQEIGNLAVIAGAGTIVDEGVQSNTASIGVRDSIVSDKETQNSLIDHGYAYYDQRNCTPVTNMEDETVDIVTGASVEVGSKEGSLGPRRSRTNTNHIELEDTSMRRVKSDPNVSVNTDTVLASKGEKFAILCKRLGKTFGGDVRDNEKGQEDIQICLEQIKKSCDIPAYPRPDSSYIVKDVIDQRPTMPPKRKYITAALRAEREERKLTIMCTIIVAVFCICWLPFVVTMCLDSLSGIRVSPFIDKATLVAGYMNSLANPMIYFYFNRSFRRRFRILNNGSK